MSQRSRSSSSSYVSQSFNSRRRSASQASQSSSQEDDDDEIQATPRPTKRARSSSSSSSTASQTQASQAASQSQPASAQISKEEREKLVGDLVRALIFYHYKRKPIAREKLREVMKDYNKTHKGLFNSLFPEAQNRVSDIFGFSVISVADKEKYILLNNVKDTELRAAVLANGNSVATDGFLSAILAILHLNSGKIEESLLFALMERLGLSKLNPKHPVLGDWTALIQKFTEQGYLVVNTKKGETDRVYAFGSRISQELDEENLKLFIRGVVAPAIRTQIPDDNNQ